MGFVNNYTVFTHILAPTGVFAAERGSLLFYWYPGAFCYFITRFLCYEPKTGVLLLECVCDLLGDYISSPIVG